MSRPLSQAQKYTLKIYRGMLRESRRFDPTIKQQIQAGFRQNKTIPQKQFLQIEFLVRQAEKKLDLMKLNATVGYQPAATKPQV